jgi:transcriptional regulator
VHAYGALRVVDNATWLRAQLGALTDHHEAAFPEPWAVSDAPHECIQRMMAAITGVELVITRLLGKWKGSRNQPTKNRTGVIAGLMEAGRPEADAMAALVGAGHDDLQAP